MLHTGEIISKSKDLLDKASDPKRKELSKWYYPTSMKVIGVKSSDMKFITGSIKESIKHCSTDEKIRLCNEMALSGVFEIQQLAFNILNRNFSLIQKLSYNDLLILGSFMDNWPSTDSYGTQIAGPAWRLGCIDDSNVCAWADSEDLWWRRVALVSTVGLNLRSQKGEGDVKRTLLICELLKEDREDMVVKAMSWALRELSKRFPDDVRRFINDNKPLLAGRVVREVNNKLNTGRKN